MSPRPGCVRRGVHRPHVERVAAVGETVVQTPVSRSPNPAVELAALQALGCGEGDGSRSDVDRS